ncbi:Non-specific serine/threonine protein kinase [Sulfidibacter corallicola]|uniref:Protein kinase n=1 Tax=Sulfidibacter corallicola TaxID=2818388 RepID=A0A8A4TJ17_SULCO|nr:protein kinase [Sulfidibacter corallicola]QTD49593.1 protein kinase [Sulfidibacter corallicola]
MPAFGDLELALNRGDTGYVMQMRYDQPDSDVHIRLSPTDHELTFRIEELEAARRSPMRYGVLLAEDLFADEEVKKTFLQICTDATSRGAGLRVRLSLAANLPELHALHWETLCDPVSGDPLFLGEGIVFSRMPTFADWRPVVIGDSPQLKAVVAVASPKNATDFDLVPFDRSAETDRAMKGLDYLNPTAVEPADPEAILSVMREGCDLLYLVCHGSFEKNTAWLWLEDRNGMANRVAARDLARRIADLEHPPRLIVLVSPDNSASPANHPLAKLGPELAAAGVPAVLALLGAVSEKAMDHFMPAFFHELDRHATIDRAVAAARGALRNSPDWWKPVLFLRLKSGRLWRTRYQEQDMIGRHIGPYRLERELGRGGMGAVYLGVRSDGELRMKVAVKLLNREMTSPRMLDRFRRERQVLADLNHPHIAVLHDAGTTEDGFPWFIMEYIEGEHIDQWCIQNQPPTATLLRMIRKSAEALGYAHRAGIVHRDIKPHNLMVTEAGEPKLLDFGIARLAHLEETDTAGRGEVLMTPAYAAPEQRMGHPVEEATDVYALGLVLLQLLTGFAPNHLDCKPSEAITRLMAEGRQATVAMDPPNDDPTVPFPSTHKSHPSGETQPSPLAGEPDSNAAQMENGTIAPGASNALEDPRHQGEPLPEALGYVLRRALATNPRERYHDMDELIAGLNRVLAALLRNRSDQPGTKKVYDALFWYHPDDADSVAELTHYLENEADLRIWQKPEWQGLSPDGSSRALDTALELSRACLICLGPGQGHARETPWEHDPAKRDTLAFRAEDLRLIPLLLPGAAFPEKQSELPVYLRGLTWRRLDNRHDHSDLAQLAEAIRGIRTDERASSLPAGICPFRGLEVFREEDRHLFFGREAVVQRVTEYLDRHPFIALLGPSGSGKSSVVQAGVIPWLRDRDYAVALFTPTHQPLEELAFVLRSLLRESGSDQPTEYLLNRLRSSPEALHFITREIFDQRGQQRLCLVIDQFEEIFTLAKDARERAAFVAGLCYAVDQPGSKVSVLVTMRSDFLGKCVVFPDINHLFLEHALQVTPMNRGELARAIETPARLSGLSLEPGLLERILDDVAGAPGELPLLEHALLELYERRRGTLLTLAAYGEIGGIEGALARRAESEYAALDDHERQTLRKMFVLCLIHPGEGAEDTRRRATGEELVAVGGATVESLIQRWTASRLLTGTRDEGRDVDLVDVAHEALIRRWKRIGEWMAEDRETARLLNRLRQSARAWADADRSEDHLLRGGPLYQMKELVAREEPHLGALEKEFVAAGVALAEREIRAGEETAARLRRRRNQAFAATAVALLLAALAFAMFFRSHREKIRAQAEKTRAEAAQQIAEQRTLESNYSLAVMYTEKAGNALENHQPQEAWLYALAALSGHIPEDRSLPAAVGRFADPAMEHAANLLWTTPVDHGVNRAAFSPDGGLLALAGKDHLIRLIDRKNGGPAGLLVGHTNHIRALAFRPGVAGSSEGLLASAGEDFKVHLWTLPDGPWASSGPSRVLDHGETVVDLAFSPDGETLATATSEGTVQLWSLASPPKREPTAIWTAGETPLASLAFSTDGTLLARGSDSGILEVRSLATGETIAVLDAKAGRLSDLEATGNRWLSAHAGGDILIWDPSKQAPERIASGQSGGVAALAVLPDGRTLVSLGSDGSMVSWDLHGGERLATLRPARASRRAFGDWRMDLVPDPEGTTLSVLWERWSLWDLSSGERKAALSGHSAEIRGIAFSPDGKTLASASGDRKILLWDVQSGTQKAALSGHEGTVWSVAFSPDGHTLASASLDRTILLWDIQARTPRASLVGHSAPIWSIAYSPDGRTLASASYDQTIKLWDAATGAALQTLSGHSAEVWSVAFAPDGKTLASGSSDQTIKLWDLATGKIEKDLSGHSAGVFSVAFNPAGNTLASGSFDQTIKLWHPATGEARATLRGHSAQIRSLAFAPDGRTLASASYDQSIKLWDTVTGEEPTTFSGHSDLAYHVAFSPDGRLLASASFDHTVKLWDVTCAQAPAALAGHDASVWSVAFAPDGASLVSASFDQTLKFWPAPAGNTGAPPKPESLATGVGHSAEVLSVSFSPDGRLVASASYDQTVRLWDATSGASKGLLQGHTAQVFSVAFSPRSNALASASWDKTIKIWDVDRKEARLTLSGHDAAAYHAIFSPDGHSLASASRDKTVRLWDVRTGRERATLSGHSGAVLGLAFSPDGQILASASRDRSVKLWDVRDIDGQAASGKAFATLAGHRGAVLGVAFSPDGRTLATSSGDDSVRLWDVASQRPLATLLAHAGDVNRLAFAPDGRTLVTPHDDGSLHVWRLDDLAPFIATRQDRAAWHQIRQRALFHFGYRLDEAGLVHEKRFVLAPLNGFDFPERHSYADLARPKPRDTKLIRWLRQGGRD